MEMEIVLPDVVAVMTLPEVAFFPQALLPLHIFEPRYRAMLKDVLATHRLFAVAGLNTHADTQQFEPPHRSRVRCLARRTGHRFTLAAHEPARWECGRRRRGIDGEMHR